MTLIGLLITKDDHTVIGEWCDAQLGLYDSVVCLDGSGSNQTEREVRTRGDCVVYMHERDFNIPYKTDHGLRRVVHQEIVRRFGTNNWVMCCHADEFCYHDPRKVAARAETEGFDLVSWYSLQFVPHPDELADPSIAQATSIRMKSRYFHWSYQGTGLPWLEDRLYRNGPRVVWDQVTHGSVRPHRVGSPAPFHPALCHYKVVTFDMDDYDQFVASTYYRSHWQGLEHRTGLPFVARRPEDFYVRSLPGYTRCDRFDGVFQHAWNIGEEFRPDPASSVPEFQRNPAVC